jgi:hypothetical protein
LRHSVADRVGTRPAHAVRAFPASLPRAARRADPTAAVDVYLILAGDAVLAHRDRIANSIGACLALTVGADVASLSALARRAREPAAVDVRLDAVESAVGAVQGRKAHAGRKIRRIDV